jgi:predicted DNA-binding WGR domain protein
LYPVTHAELKDKTISRRYAGHQVNPRQALALLGGRGWVNVPEEGVRRTFHEEGLSAWLEFLEGFYTPADVEGLTLEGVRFTKRGEWNPLDLKDIPPRLFSEVMRDLDLVVSVAHRGGVDPEASASTIEMRTNLMRETFAVLSIENVEFKKDYAIIRGELGQYSVHLGSGVVHKMPGGAMLIVPVHSQHRGRIFLPFADDDPKTAEVLSKVLLLARDQSIQDPNILAQIQVLGKVAPDRAAKKRPTKRAVAQQTPKRYFELEDDKSSKFWEVAVDGKEVTVRFGRIGAKGQTQVKTFDTPAVAKARAEKLIREKTAKGYEERSPAG